MFGTKSKTRPPAALTEAEQERIDAYLTACANLSDAIVERCADFLVWRGRQMAACISKSLPPAAIDVLEAQGSALGAELKEGLARVDWLKHAQWLRYRSGDSAPPELHPLAVLVESHLAAIRGLYGLPLHPLSGLGKPLDHQPLAAWSWPGPTREKRCVTRSHPGLKSWTALEDAWVPHPIHSFFRSVADAAQRIETINLTKGTNE